MSRDQLLFLNANTMFLSTKDLFECKVTGRMCKAVVFTHAPRSHTPTCGMGEVLVGVWGGRAFVLKGGNFVFKRACGAYTHAVAAQGAGLAFDGDVRAS